MADRAERLSAQQLTQLLRERIAGIDINPEAIRLAAFSLYLAYLNYLDPRDIITAGPLPRLVYRAGGASDSGILVVADAFSPLLSESENPDKHNQGESDRSPGSIYQDSLPWEEGSFGVIVGNPPWDEPPRGKASKAEAWAARNNLPIGDRSPSQLFMWRTLSLLRPGGTAALLVAATAFHNVRAKSKKFRQRWLDAVELDSVVNFSAARWVFFTGGLKAPFYLVTFRHSSNQSWPIPTAPVLYRTVRPSKALDATRSMAYASSARRWVGKEALRQRDYLWKTYAWGSHLDSAFMARLDAEQQLREVLPKNPRPGWGYQYGPNEPSEYLASIPSLGNFTSWGPGDKKLEFEAPPRGVKRQPDERRYHGQRILITRGVRAGFGPAVRLIDIPCSFRHTIYCLPMPSLPVWQAQVIFATLLSSLGRYRIFMHTGSWGVWYDSITSEDILDFPIRLTSPDDPIVERIQFAVDQLYDWYEDEPPWGILQSMDEAVFDLFELSAYERDLVSDFHAYTLGLVGLWTKAIESVALSPITLPPVRWGRFADLVRYPALPLVRYLYRFVGEWNRELEADGEFSWHVVNSPRSEMTAVIFETHNRGADLLGPGDEDEWRALLDRLSASLRTQVTPSVISEGVLRSVSDTSIVVIKRNETRLWTATTAQEDVEATKLQAIALQER